VAGTKIREKGKGKTDSGLARTRDLLLLGDCPLRSQGSFGRARKRVWVTQEMINS